MKLLLVKNTGIPLPYHSFAAIPDSKVHIRNLAGSMLALLLALLGVAWLLLPELAELVAQIFASPGESVMLLAGTLLALLFVLLPATWFVRSLMEHRVARTLDRMGIMARGTVLDKWVDDVNGNPVYYIRYKYSAQLNAAQVVERRTFEQLMREEPVFVLHLEDQPQVSRLDLD